MKKATFKKAISASVMILIAALAAFVMWMAACGGIAQPEHPRKIWGPEYETE